MRAKPAQPLGALPGRYRARAASVRDEGLLDRAAGRPGNTAPPENLAPHVGRLPAGRGFVSPAREHGQKAPYSREADEAACRKR